MINITHVQVDGWEAAIRGMRNPKNSWDRSDSQIGYTYLDNVPQDAVKIGVNCKDCVCKYVKIGENDLKLMNSLYKAGSDHRKFLRFIDLTCDIVAPLYWWKEFQTYKVGTVSNSCSTMYKITSKEFTLDDFSHEHLDQYSLDTLNKVIENLNINRNRYLECTDEAKKKDIWWQLIQLLPSSYNQKRTIKMSYEVLVNLNRLGRRKNHKLDEWREFCKFVDNLPYYKDITQED